MKRLLFFFTLLFLLSWQLGATPVTVSGHVLFTDGTLAADWPVFIGPFDPNGGSSQVAITDQTGYYTIEVDLPAGDSSVEVQTFDECFHTPIVQWAPVSNGEATADFVLCNGQGGSDCWAYASAQLLAGLNVQFNGEGYGQDSLANFTFSWDFGDGASSTDQNPAHTYAAPGFYTVTLTINSPDCSNTVSLLVDVFPVQNVTVSGQVTDQNGSGVPAWFVWIETQPNDPAGPGGYAYTDDQGFYSTVVGLPVDATTVTAHTWDFCSPNGITGTAPIVNNAAQIDFQICFDSFPPQPDCWAYITYANLGGLSYQFSANTYPTDSAGAFVYEWLFEDGSTSTEPNPVHTFANDGVFTIQLTVTTANGCVVHACEVVCTFNSGVIDTFYYGCQAMFVAAWGGQPDPAGVIDPLILSFTDLSFGGAMIWHWDFGDGSTDTVQNPVHTYAASGLYTVTLHITTANGCESEVAMQVYAGDGFTWTQYGCQAMFLPIPDSTGNGFLFLDLSVAASPTISWEWQFGDGTSSTEQNPYHEYAQAGVYTVSLTITADSCSSVISFELDTNDPFHHFRPDGGVLGLAAGATSTTQVPALDQLKVFPNPVSEELTVAFNSLEVQPVEMVLSNLAGQSVQSNHYKVSVGNNALRIPVQNLGPGLYLMQLRTADQVQTVKIVKQ